MQFERVSTQYQPRTAADVRATARLVRQRQMHRDADAQARRLAARKAAAMAEQERKREEDERARLLLQRYRLAVDRPATVSSDAKTSRVEDVIRAACNHFDVSKTDMLSARRDRQIVIPRQVAMYVARTVTLQSQPAIGAKFGNRDHTTVLHAVGKIRDALAAGDEQLASDVAAIKRALGVA